MSEFADIIETHMPTPKSASNPIEWKVQALGFTSTVAFGSWANFINDNSGGTANITNQQELSDYLNRTPYIRINNLIDATNNDPFSTEPASDAITTQITASGIIIPVQNLMGTLKTLNLKLHSNNAIHELFSGSNFIAGFSSVLHTFRRQNYITGSSNPTVSGEKQYRYFRGFMQRPGGYNPIESSVLTFTGEEVAANDDNEANSLFKLQIANV